MPTETTKQLSPEALAFAAQEHWSARLVEAQEAIKAANREARVEVFVGATIVGVPENVLRHMEGMLEVGRG